MRSAGRGARLRRQRCVSSGTSGWRRRGGGGRRGGVGCGNVALRRRLRGGDGGLRRRRRRLAALLRARGELDQAAVVFLDVLVGAVEAQGLAVLLGGVVEVAVGLVGDREVVVGHGVVGLHLDGALEPEHRFAPEVHLRHAHAELALRLGLRRVGAAGTAAESDDQNEKDRQGRRGERPLHLNSFARKRWLMKARRLYCAGSHRPRTAVRAAPPPSRTGSLMNDSPVRDLLIALSLLPFLTPNRIRLLFENCDSAEAACNGSPEWLQGLLSVTPQQALEVKNPLRDQAAKRLVTELRDRVITRLDPEYPPMLLEIPDPPLVLHFRRDASLLARPGVAIVGSRRASPYAINAAHQLAAQVASAGLTVVSGLARGVDAASHAAALDAGGRTVAVLGTGIDRIYPRSHARLFRRIEAGGAIVSEFPPGTPPRPENFPVRNRIISGLTHGTVIVEATGRSGSLITARLAAEQNREVFAVPG